MDIKKTFEIISALYSKRPFIDETGQVTVVPGDLDSLINAIGLYERLIYLYPTQISSFTQEHFLQETKEFITTIPVDHFRSEMEHLEYSSKEVVFRTLDKVLQEYPDDLTIQLYCKSL